MSKHIIDLDDERVAKKARVEPSIKRVHAFVSYIGEDLTTTTIDPETIGEADRERVINLFLEAARSEGSDLINYLITYVQDPVGEEILAKNSITKFVPDWLQDLKKKGEHGIWNVEDDGRQLIAPLSVSVFPGEF